MSLGFAVIAKKTTFDKKFKNTIDIVNGIKKDQKTIILQAMQELYNGSTIAQGMFDDWIDKNRNKTIRIGYKENDFAAQGFSGNLFIDLNYIKDLTYITQSGQSVRYQLIQALAHEFGHAFNGLLDPRKDLGFSDQQIDYTGTNIPFVNTIWEQLKFKPMSTYFTTAKSSLQPVGYQYTNGSIIDNAVNLESTNDLIDPRKRVTSNWNTSALAKPLSKDLLIGGPSNNVLTSNGGDDFLYGGGGDDTLDGGEGNDTAVYMGKCSDYEISEISSLDGFFGKKTWKVKSKNGKYGTDTLIGIDYVQFDDPKKPGKKEIFKLENGGLKCQKDIALVFDTTGSSGKQIAYLKSLSKEIVAAASGHTSNGVTSASNPIDSTAVDEHSDTRFAIIGFKDTQNAEPSKVFLPFTEQDDFADREAAVIAALDSMVDISGYGYGVNEYYSPLGERPPITPPANSIIFGGGGDKAETPFDGLRLALNGSIGEWRYGAGTRQIFLFTDAPVKDSELAAEVTALAHSIGATTEPSSAIARSGGSVNTFNLTFSDSSSANIDPNPTTAQVQIFTILTGGWGEDTAALEAISRDNGGDLFVGLSQEQLLTRLIEIINPSPVIDLTPTISVIASVLDTAETTVGEIANPAQFTLTRTGDLSQALTVAYTLADPATNGTDYQTLTNTVTFVAGEDTATIDLIPIDDNIYEGDETVTLTLTDGGTQYQLDPTEQEATVTIADNETQPIIRIANVTQTEGNKSKTNYGFNITLSNPSVETVEVKYSTADVTATAGSDYTATTGTITFNPGETSKTIDINVNGDNTLEQDETFTVNLTEPVNGTIDRSTGIGTILDDDRPVIALTITDPNVAEAKKDSGQFSLTRTGILNKALTVSYTIAGTATNETDYKKLTGTATFKAGAAQTTIDLKPIDDKIYEGNETVIITINDGGISYKADPTAKTQTLIITDDDLPSISLSVTDDKAAETKIGQPNNPGQFTIKRTGITTNALTVSYSLNGTASNGIDYQQLGDSITFAAGSDTAIIDIKPIDDQFFERTETVTLKLATNSNYSIDGAKSKTVKIADNDNPRDRKEKDLVLNVENLDDFTSPIGTGLQGGLEGEVIDLRGFTGQTLSVDTVAVGDSTYKSYIGFYTVEDAQGTLASGLKVSDPGYAQAAIKSALLRSFKTESTTDLNLTGGKILAPVVIANGTFEDYLKRNPQNQASSDIHAYFDYIGANTDKVDHFRLLGDNKFGIEDIYGGGDRDYNDIIFQMNIKG
jgi:Calx-beta domain/Domain of unknown function (DUF4114)/RTX calcium-binding nonapeptide repeat (4 copies)